MKIETEINVSKMQGIPAIAGNYQKLGEKHGIDSPSDPLGGTNSADTLISYFQPPEL